jgi:hypothetical protein
MVMNITSEAYQNNKDRLLGLTFLERLLTVHHVMSAEEKETWAAKEEKAKRMCYHKTITEDDISKHVEMPLEYMGIVRHLSREFSYASLNSPISCQDLIKGTLKAHASLNGRPQVCADDLRFVMLIKPYLRNPYSPCEGEIVKLRAEGLSIREIGRKIGKSNYNRQIQRVIQKAQLRGILDV